MTSSETASPPAPAVALDAEARARARDRPAEHDVMLWRPVPGAARGRGRTPLVYLPGLGPHVLGRTRAQRALQRVGVLPLARSFDVWLVAARAPLPTGTTVASLAAARAEAIRARFDHPVDVVGASTGGTIALQLAIDHPDVVRRLVLVSAAYRLGDDGREAQRAVASRLRARRPRRAAAVLLGTTTVRTGARRLLQVVGYGLGRWVIGRDDADLVRLIDAEDVFDVRTATSAIAAPTLLVGGRRDGYYPPELFAETVALIPDARRVEHASRGHISGTSRAARRAIREHLSEM